MKKTERLSIKIDTRTLMIIEEMAKQHKTSKSAIVRMFCYKGIKNIIDEKGYIKSNL